MSENEIAAKIVNTCFHIHNNLGPGLYEAVYEEILTYELERSGLKVERQKPVGVNWKNIKIDKAFKADLVIEGKVIIELKSVEALLPVHKKQVITYLKLTDLKLGLLINFNVELIKNGVLRIVNRL